MLSSSATVFVERTLMPAVAAAVSATVLTWMSMENSRHNERLAAAARKKLTPAAPPVVMHQPAISSHGTPSYSEGNQ